MTTPNELYINQTDIVYYNNEGQITGWATRSEALNTWFDIDLKLVENSRAYQAVYQQVQDNLGADYESSEDRDLSAYVDKIDDKIKSLGAKSSDKD